MLAMRWQPRETDGLTRWLGVWTLGNSLPYINQRLQCSRGNRIQSCYPTAWYLLLSPCLSYWRELRSQAPLPSSCGQLPPHSLGLQGAQAILAQASLCWLPTQPPGQAQHLVQPSAIQQGCELVKAGFCRVQQELDSEQVFLEQEEGKKQMRRQTERWEQGLWIKPQTAAGAQRPLKPKEGARLWGAWVSKTPGIRLPSWMLGEVALPLPWGRGARQTAAGL